MKKSLFLLTLMLMIVAGCSKDEEEPDSNVLPVTPQLLVGKWYYGDVYDFKIIEFRADNTGRYDYIKDKKTQESYQFTYKIDTDGETILINKTAFITNEDLGTTEAIIYNQDGSSQLFVVGYYWRFTKMSE